MGQPSFAASNAIIYLSYGAFLCAGLIVAWTLRKQSKSQYLNSNRTQKGIPLALNFIASGVQGLVVYTLSSSLPLLAFAALGPVIRRKCPDGFVLTEWTRQRYGILTALYLSVMTLITLFLYMVSELSAIQQIVNLLTGLNGLPVVIVQCVVTTIYTSAGGFKVSFITDNIQGAMVLVIIIIGAVAIGTTTHVDTSKIGPSGLLDASLLGWQLLYILPVAILTNDMFLSGFWLRTFASRTDKDLWIGVSIATVVVTIIIVLVGSTGLIAAWSGAWDPSFGDDGYLALFYLLEQLPAWVVGVTLVMVVTLSTAAFDSLQSAMVSTASNDLFRNKLHLWWIRGLVVLIIIPVVVVALKSPNILQIYLISDLVSAAVIPVLFIGLWGKCYWWRGFEVIVGGLGGILSVFIFGTIYYGSARQGANLILLEGGLYTEDWGAFGAFVAAPVGGFLFGVAACALRLATLWLKAKLTHTRFDALDRPVETTERRSVSGSASGASAATGADDADADAWQSSSGPADQIVVAPSKTGKFF